MVQSDGAKGERAKGDPDLSSCISDDRKYPIECGLYIFSSCTKYLENKKQSICDFILTIREIHSQK